MIQTLQHKGTHVTKAVCYMHYLEVIIYDSNSKMRFKFTSKKRSHQEEVTHFVMLLPGTV